jgi:MFS transporter, putative metabolite:H+ symporter
MFDVLDRQSRLTANQKKLVFAGTFGVILEFLDYFLIGFILTFVAKPWGLSFAQSSMILLSSGVGAMIGAVVFGWLADAIGRRGVFLTTITIFTVGTGALIFTPESAQTGWIYLIAMRFLIGFGAGGLYCVDLPLIQEFMPSRLRGSISGLVTAAVPGGFLLGSALVAFVAPSIGWHGLMAVCVALSLVALFMRTWIPESPRWLMQRGRVDDARASLAWALQVPVSSLQRPAPVAAAPKVGFLSLLRHPRSVAVALLINLGTQTGYYGLTLWSPTLIVHALGVPPARAAFYMIFITLAAFGGRIAISLLSERIGRRMTGVLSSGAAVVALLAAAQINAPVANGAALFLICMAVAYFFGEGGFAVVGPYSAEVWPSRLRTTGMGAAYGFGGIGKVIGPLGLAFIAGASGAAAPATSSIDPHSAFTYFAVWYGLSCLAFLTLGFETRGRSFEDLDKALEQTSVTTVPRPRAAA